MAPKSSIILASALVIVMSASAVICDGGINGGGQFQAGFEEKEITVREEGGLNGLLGGLNGFGSGFGDFLGGFGGSKREELVEKKIVEKEAKKEGFLGVKGPIELIKLLFNPLELIKQISTFFKLEKLGLIETIGKGATFGIEVALQPALLSIKIIEKVFVPDACRLKLVCELGRPIQILKGAMPKFSPGFLDGASTLKAFSDGVLGHECEALYACGGELKLKKEFELLKTSAGNKLAEIKNGALSEFQGGESYSGEQSFAASNLRPSTVTKDAKLAL